MQFNIPIYLTWFRIILVPFLILSFYLPCWWSPLLTAIIFIIAALTDFFDGLLARFYKQTTIFGAFLDPVADKIIVTITLVLLVQWFHTWWFTLPAVVIIAREILVSALRQWMSEIGKRAHIKVLIISKIKTILQMLSLFLLLLRSKISITATGIFILYVSVILTFCSMFCYLKKAKIFFNS